MSKFEGSQAVRRLTQDEARFFVLFRPSTDWMNPTHIREDNLLDLVYNIHVTLIQKHLQRNT